MGKIWGTKEEASQKDKGERTSSIRQTYRELRKTNRAMETKSNRGAEGEKGSSGIFAGRLR